MQSHLPTVACAKDNLSSQLSRLFRPVFMRDSYNIRLKTLTCRVPTVAASGR